MVVLSKIKGAIKKLLPQKAVEKIQSIVVFILSYINNSICKRRYHHLASVKVDKSDIKIGFLVQMPEIWDKQAPLVDALIKNSVFHPIIIVIPPYDFVKKIVSLDYGDNFFLKNYSDFAVKAYENNQWINIKDLKLDYLFYQRPYDWYLPKELQSKTISKHTRCCYIPYAFWPFKHDLCGYNRTFFRSLFFGFMESKENCEEIIKRGDYEADKRYIFCGYPSLDQQECGLCCPDHGFTTVLWTPRWSYDEKVGGSHFFEYKDSILSIAKEFNDIKVILRPHPLSFQNYVSEGKMTEIEVEAYKKKVIESGASFDANEAIEETFKDVDILITDISSIVYTYVLYEKPIIFCDANMIKSPSFESLMECMYIANNWSDVLKWIHEIRNGNDLLKEKRHLFADKIRSENKGAVDNIIDYLISNK